MAAPDPARPSTAAEARSEPVADTRFNTATERARRAWRSLSPWVSRSRVAISVHRLDRPTPDAVAAPLATK